MIFAKNADECIGFLSPDAVAYCCPKCLGTSQVSEEKSFVINVSLCVVGLFFALPFLLAM
jgi:hypothetical protein